MTRWARSRVDGADWLRAGRLAAVLGTIALPLGAHAQVLELTVNTAFTVADQFVGDGPESLGIIKDYPVFGDLLLASHGNDCEACTIETYLPDGTYMGPLPTEWGEIRGLDPLDSGNIIIASLDMAPGVVNVVESVVPALIPLGMQALTFRQRFVVEIDRSGATVPGGLLINLTGPTPEVRVTAGPTFPGNPNDIVLEVVHRIDQLESVFVLSEMTQELALLQSTFGSEMGGGVLYIWQAQPR